MKIPETSRAALFGTALLALFPAATFGQTRTSPAPAQGAAVRVAVIEFSPGPAASGMTHEDKRHLQSSMAFALQSSRETSRRFSVVDVRHTREASAGDLAAINGDSSTAAAVRAGKQLGVSYVLTGTVVDFSPKGADNFGLVTLKTRYIEVATGKVVHAAETRQRSTSAMRTDGSAEIHAKAVKPATLKLASALAGL